MPNKKIFIFLLLSVLFAITHYVAVTLALYWYHWWFDIFMHFWGGCLIVLGAHIFSQFSFINIQPSLKLVCIVLLVVAGVWEIFEWFAGLYEPATYLRDTAKDVVVGFSGGLLAHSVLTRYTIK